MLGRRERHCSRARRGGWPVNIAIKPWAVVPAFFATGVLRQSAGPFHFASRPIKARNLVEFARASAGSQASFCRRQGDDARFAGIVSASGQERSMSVNVP